MIARPARVLGLTALVYIGATISSTFTVEPWMVKPLVFVFGTVWDAEMHEISQWHECIAGKPKTEWVRCAQ